MNTRVKLQLCCFFRTISRYNVACLVGALHSVLGLTRIPLAMDTEYCKLFSCSHFQTVTDGLTATPSACGRQEVCKSYAAQHLDKILKWQVLQWRSQSLASTMVCLPGSSSEVAKQYGQQILPPRRSTISSNYFCLLVPQAFGIHKV